MAKVKIQTLETVSRYADVKVTAPDKFGGHPILTVHDLPWDDSVYVEIGPPDHGQDFDDTDWNNIVIKRKHWDKLVAALSKGEEK